MKSKACLRNSWCQLGAGVYYGRLEGVGVNLGRGVNLVRNILKNGSEKRVQATRDYSIDRENHVLRMRKTKRARFGRSSYSLPVALHANPVRRLYLLVSMVCICPGNSSTSYSIEGMTDVVEEIVREIWEDFSSFDVGGKILDLLYSRKVINRTAREKITKANTSSDAARYFLMHLEGYATIGTLRTLLAILRETAKDHERHKELADLLEHNLPKLVSIAI